MPKNNEFLKILLKRILLRVEGNGVKIEFPIMPPVNSLAKAQAPVQASAVGAANERQGIREDSKKKRVSKSSSNSEPAALPKYSSLVARELSSRLASEAHRHEREEAEEEKEEDESSDQSDKNDSDS